MRSTWNEYGSFVDRSLSLDKCDKIVADDNFKARYLAAMGLAGEGGEVLELHKKELFHGKPIDREKLVKELGDVLWYFVLALRANKISLYEVIAKNVTKLLSRYPGRGGIYNEEMTANAAGGNYIDFDGFTMNYRGVPEFSEKVRD